MKLRGQTRELLEYLLDNPEPYQPSGRDVARMKQLATWRLVKRVVTGDVVHWVVTQLGEACALGMCLGKLDRRALRYLAAHRGWVSERGLSGVGDETLEHLSDMLYIDRADDRDAKPGPLSRITPRGRFIAKQLDYLESLEAGQ